MLNSRDGNFDGRVSAEISVAHVEFEDAYSVKIALFLSVSFFYVLSLPKL